MRSVNIPLRNHKGDVVAYTVIDAEDAYLADRRWSLHNDGYAKGSLPRNGSTQKKIMLHQAIMRPGVGLEVDHIDGDRLNNRRSNLRVVTKFQNQQNRRDRDFGVSAYRGVAWHKRIQKWHASAGLNRRTHHLGYFDDEHEAGKVAAEFRLAHMTHTNEVA